MSIYVIDHEQKLKINGIFLSLRGITLPKIITLQPNSNLTCIFSRHIYILNFNSKCQFEIMSRNWKFVEFSESKGHNSAKNYLAGLKFQLDLRIIVTNSYTKFKISMYVVFQIGVGHRQFADKNWKWPILSEISGQNGLLKLQTADCMAPWFWLHFGHSWM